jgi:hypothetical protein
MEKKTVEYVEAVMQFHRVKVGDVFTERQVKAIQHLFGDLYEKLGELKTILDVRFSKTGEATVVQGADLLKSFK